MVETKDVIYYIIQGFGVLVTSVFSFLIWQATTNNQRRQQQKLPKPLKRPLGLRRIHFIIIFINSIY